MKPSDHWLPYGYDPVWHAPTAEPWEKRKHDVSLLGLHYPQRTNLMNTLRDRGHKIYYDIGPCYEDAMDIYHNTRVGVNWSSLQDTTARVFELMAFRIVPVLNRVPDLMDMFEDGRDYLGFDSQTEAVEQVERALADQEFSDIIAHNALEAVRPHTWDARIETILETTGVMAQGA